MTQGQGTAAPSTVTAGPAAWRKELLFSVGTAYVEPLRERCTQLKREGIQVEFWVLLSFPGLEGCSLLHDSTLTRD